MRQSIIGAKLLPESAADYEELRLSHRAHYTTCCQCDKPFGNANVKSSLGWAETQISGMCEVCFDNLFEEEE